jgi:sulfate transport system substrate-binding protein
MKGTTGTSRWLAAGITAITLAFGGVPAAHADTSLLNVSYDVTRELYKDINAGLSPPTNRRAARP